MPFSLFSYVLVRVLSNDFIMKAKNPTYMYKLPK